MEKSTHEHKKHVVFLITISMLITVQKEHSNKMTSSDIVLYP